MALRSHVHQVQDRHTKDGAAAQSVCGEDDLGAGSDLGVRDGNVVVGLEKALNHLVPVCE
jgi:hypothetical protein